MDEWFIRLALAGLFGYFLWSLRQVLTRLEKQIEKLGEHIGKLFDGRSDHDKRISVMEARCDMNHGGVRRGYDPDERPAGRQQ